MYHLLSKLNEWGVNSQSLGFIEAIFQKSEYIRNVYTDLLGKLSSPPPKGLKVMEEEWDYLIVLDACRFDTFKKINSLPGTLYQRTSLAPNTSIWIRRNFPEEYSNTICIGANAWLSDLKLKEALGKNPFSYLDKVWSYGWDENLGTVPPREVTAAALRSIEKYPEKRAIIFYLQPHHPFIGDVRLEWKSKELQGEHNWVHTEWYGVKTGELSVKDVKKAYEANLQLVLKEVEDLISKLDGKIVLTSDHGNCFGDLFLHGHPKVFIKPLLEIPWFVVENKRLETVPSKLPTEKERLKRRIRGLSERLRSKTKVK